MPRRGFREALARPASRRLAVVAALPIVILALVAGSATLAMGGPTSQRILEEHIRRKQRFLWLKRTGQIPKKVKFKTWEKHNYPRRRVARPQVARA